MFLDRDGDAQRAPVVDGRPSSIRRLERARAAAGRRGGVRGAVRAPGSRSSSSRTSRTSPAARRPEAVRRRINARLQELLALDEVVVCPHDDADGCACRKPKPGMLLDAAGAPGRRPAAERHGGRPLARRRGGPLRRLRTVFIDRGYTEPVARTPGPDRPEPGRSGRLDHRSRRESDRRPASPANCASRSSPTARTSRRRGAARRTRSSRAFTTNPTLMRKAGVTDYESFARELLELVPDRPISFEVFSDDFAEMERQARLIASWGENVYVKIPITTTRRARRRPTVVARLSASGVKVNVTGCMTLAQVEWSRECVAGGPRRVHLRLRRADRRHRARSRSRSWRSARGHGAATRNARADLGQPARDAERRAGRRDRLPHHHRHHDLLKKLPMLGATSTSSRSRPCACSTTTPRRPATHSKLAARYPADPARSTSRISRMSCGVFVEK